MLNFFLPVKFTYRKFSMVHIYGTDTLLLSVFFVSVKLKSISAFIQGINAFKACETGKSLFDSRTVI